MKILSVAFPLAPVGPDAVGGAEQILTHIDEAVVAAGHESFVIACEGSSVKGSLISIPGPVSTIGDGDRVRAHRHMRQAIGMALHDISVDIVHMHGIDFTAYIPGGSIPVLVTMHLPLSWYPREAFELQRPRTYLQCVSYSQFKESPEGFQCAGVIGNGVSVDRLQPLRRSFGYAVALGRICPEKGFHLAAMAARKANIPFLLGGTVFGYESHVQYFRDSIEPLLEKRIFRYIGPVGLRYKRLLLAGARCLIVSSLVSETSSLVAMESLACGTPVIAFKSGALGEIVEDGKTGFLVADVDEMADAIRASGSIDRNECRKSAVARFSSSRMTAEYISLYHKLLDSPAIQTSRLQGRFEP